MNDPGSLPPDAQDAPGAVVVPYSAAKMFMELESPPGTWRERHGRIQAAFVRSIDPLIAIFLSARAAAARARDTSPSRIIRGIGWSWTTGSCTHSRSQASRPVFSCPTAPGSRSFAHTTSSSRTCSSCDRRRTPSAAIATTRIEHGHGAGRWNTSGACDARGEDSREVAAR